MKLKLAEDNHSTLWEMKHLESALADLKRNKSRDHEGYINEIFKSDVIGANLKDSLLLLFNKLKKEKIIPLFMRFSNITTVPKKGSRIELKNERGIFRVSVVRSILMRLIYDTKYPIVDENMSDCQMGARKKKGCKNNIFIINGIIHETLKSKRMKPILLQIYDFSQMFDSINLEEALCDMYDVGVNDDNLALLHLANKEVNMAVKTPSGLTERQTIENIVLQGDTWGSILASVQVNSIGKECLQAGHFYLYKDILPVGFLGLVDDVIGITLAGYQAQMMNAFLNVKSAEKTLQFGISKCKSMLVGKDTQNVLNNELSVDKWDVKYEDDKETGEVKLVETYCGLTAIEKTEEQTYLGFVLSSTGDNMANIRKIRNKSIGIIIKIFNRLNSLNLQQYYFECSLILMNVMLRSSILYACEMYYNLKESEIRQIERMEESFLRQVMKTTKGCPISQLYLELGQIPARYEIIKMRLLYLYYILQQSDESLLKKFFNLQIVQPTRRDWAETCKKNLKELQIHENFDEIKLMKKSKFKNLLKEKVKINALKYLNNKRGSKGSEIIYTDLEMADYLHPSNNYLTIDQKRKMFSVRNRMIKIESNFPKQNLKNYCYCGKEENMTHIYNCELLNKKKPNIPYERLFFGNITHQIEVFERFDENFKKWEELKSEKENCLPCDPIVIRCSQ